MWEMFCHTDLKLFTTCNTDKSQLSLTQAWGLQQKCRICGAQCSHQTLDLWSSHFSELHFVLTGPGCPHMHTLVVLAGQGASSSALCLNPDFTCPRGHGSFFCGYFSLLSIAPEFQPENLAPFLQISSRLQVQSKSWNVPKHFPFHG